MTKFWVSVMRVVYEYEFTRGINFSEEVLLRIVLVGARIPLVGGMVAFEMFRRWTYVAVSCQ